jgi:hypothetical protein
VDLQQPPQSTLTICSPAFLDPDDDEDAATLRVAVQLVVRSLLPCCCQRALSKRDLTLKIKAWYPILSTNGYSMESKAGPFTFAELQTVTSLGRGKSASASIAGSLARQLASGRGTTALIQSGTWSKAPSLRRCCDNFAPARSHMA